MSTATTSVSHGTTESIASNADLTRAEGVFDLQQPKLQHPPLLPLPPGGEGGGEGAGSSATSDALPALRFITCGSVDDGKSTLIGRLLVDSRAVLADQLAGVSRTGEADLAQLTDGLAAEREQGITIDVAWRYFATPARKFIIGDAPGHEQYTRNMVTAASQADCAIVLVDATKLDWQQSQPALLAQTRRHALLASGSRQ